MRFNSLILALLVATSTTTYAQVAVSSCGNPVTTPYNSSPQFFSPDGTRGVGVKIWVHGVLVSIPDTKPACLPIALRYNNLGVLKTPSKGPWPNQTTKDGKGHAIFPTVESGITAWGLWMKKKAESGKPQTAMSLMSVYAPPDDCVGSIGSPPNCPYGINPTAEYAARVASSVNKKPMDVLNLDGTDCKEGREALYALFQQIVSFEIGGNFCGRENKNTLALCSIDRELFDKAMDAVYGPVDFGKCADPAEAHE